MLVPYNIETFGEEEEDKTLYWMNYLINNDAEALACKAVYEEEALNLVEEECFGQNDAANDLVSAIFGFQRNRGKVVHLSVLDQCDAQYKAGIKSIQNYL